MHLYIIFLKSNCEQQLWKVLCAFFTPIDSFHLSVHKSIEIQLLKNEYEIFYILCKNVWISSTHISKYLTKKEINLGANKRNAAVNIDYALLTAALLLLALLRLIDYC